MEVYSWPLEHLYGTKLKVHLQLFLWLSSVNGSCDQIKNIGHVITDICEKSQ